MTIVTEPRLVEPKPLSAAEMARRWRHHMTNLALAVTTVLRPLFPADMNVTLVATQYNGKWKIRFEPPAVKETGYRD